MLGSQEHTILLSRKKLNQEMKKKNVYHCSCRHLILDHHRYHYLHALRNTVTLNSYLGLFALCNYYIIQWATLGNRGGGRLIKVGVP